MAVLIFGPTGSSAKKGAPIGEVSKVTGWAAAAPCLVSVAVAIDLRGVRIGVDSLVRGRSVLDARERDAMLDISLHTLGSLSSARATQHRNQCFIGASEDMRMFAWESVRPLTEVERQQIGCDRVKGGDALNAEPDCRWRGLSIPTSFALWLARASVSKCLFKPKPT